jgi:hypothetical protein
MGGLVTSHRPARSVVDRRAAPVNENDPFTGVGDVAMVVFVARTGAMASAASLHAFAA